MQRSFEEFADEVEKKNFRRSFLHSVGEFFRRRRGGLDQKPPAKTIHERPPPCPCRVSSTDKGGWAERLLDRLSTEVGYLLVENLLAVGEGKLRNRLHRGRRRISNRSFELPTGIARKKTCRRSTTLNQFFSEEKTSNIIQICLHTTYNSSLTTPPPFNTTEPPHSSLPGPVPAWVCSPAFSGPRASDSSKLSSADPVSPVKSLL